MNSKLPDKGVEADIAEKSKRLQNEIRRLAQELSDLHGNTLPGGEPCVLGDGGLDARVDGGLIVLSMKFFGGWVRVPTSIGQASLFSAHICRSVSETAQASIALAEARQATEAGQRVQ